MMDLRESYFDTGAVRLHVMEGPRSGPALVLLHGSVANWETWLPILPELCQSWHVYAMDLRGHGLSGRAANVEGYRIDRHVEDTLAFLREVVAEPAVLMGHSYGAVISVLSGLPGKDLLRGLVLEDPPLMLRRENTESGPYIDYFSWVLEKRQTRSTLDEMWAVAQEANPHAAPEDLLPWARTMAWVDPTYLRAITEGNRREVMAGVDFAERISGTTCPVLLLQADPARGAALVDQDIEFYLSHAPQTRLVRFPGSGHGIHNEMPGELLNAVEEWRKGLGD